MGKINGKETLGGQWGEVWFNGDKIMELEKIDVKISYNREDVQFGMDVDSKVIGQKGEFTLGIKKVYTRFENIRTAMNAGQDTRVQIITKLKDPDAVRGQTERYSVDNCWLNDLPVVSYEIGAPVKQEITGGFTPSDMVNLDRIAI